MQTLVEEMEKAYKTIDGVDNVDLRMDGPEEARLRLELEDGAGLNGQNLDYIDMLLSYKKGKVDAAIEM